MPVIRMTSPDDTPATGAITFYPGGGKMLLGYEYTWNAGGSNAILPLGKMTCVKPKKGHSAARSAWRGR